MPVIHIDSLQTPGVELFSTLTEAQLRNRLDPEKGIFIAESPKVIRVAISAGCQPLALLCEERHIKGDAADIIAACGDIPVYTGPRELLTNLTGYTLTRGVLCAMRRPTPPSVENVCQSARRVVVIDSVVDTTNIGAIFRSAARATRSTVAPFASPWAPFSFFRGRGSKRPSRPWANLVSKPSLWHFATSPSPSTAPV